MAKVNISNVTVLDNPSPFYNPFQFEITFECLEDLTEDLEWKIIYVGSAETADHDQTLDTVLVGPIAAGRHKFVFQADSPDIKRIPVADAVGVTVVLLTCSYRGREFIRVGYFVNNEYGDQETKENPPTVPNFEKLQRNILATCPRVTRFRISWDDTPGTDAENVPPHQNPENEQNMIHNMDMRQGAVEMNKANEANSMDVAPMPMEAVSNNTNSMDIAPSGMDMVQ